MAVRDIAASFELQSSTFRRRFVAIVSVIVGFTSIVRAIVSLVLVADLPTTASIFISSVCAIVLSVASLVLVRRGRDDVAAKALIYGAFGLVSVSGVVSQSSDPFGAFALVALVTISSFLISRRTVPVLATLSIVTLLLTQTTAVARGTFGQASVGFLITSCLVVITMSIIIFLFTRQANLYLEAHRQRLSKNQELFQQVQEASTHMASAAHQISTMSRAQIDGIREQAVALEETRRSLEGLLQSSDRIIGSSRQSLGNAVQTLADAQRVAERLDRLLAHAGQIGDVLTAIKDLANRSDLLALNAALEGVRLGEHGEGFALVAGRMQQHAEGTAAAARDVHRITEHIERESTETRLSVEATTRLARASAEAAETIDAEIRQARAAVAHIAEAMDDLSSIGAVISAGTDQAVASTEHLRDLAERLRQLIEE